MGVNMVPEAVEKNSYKAHTTEEVTGAKSFILPMKVQHWSAMQKYEWKGSFCTVQKHITDISLIVQEIVPTFRKKCNDTPRITETETSSHDMI